MGERTEMKSPFLAVCMTGDDLYDGPASLSVMIASGKDYLIS